MKTLILGPHPDDELLGCGGTILKRKAQGAEVAWLLVTSISEENGWSNDRVRSRIIEIEKVREGLGILPEFFFELNFPAATLDRISMATLIKRISMTIESFRPDEILLPHPGDVHGDHRVAFEAGIACTKWFRYPFIKRILTYETPSETNFGMDPRYLQFQPNKYEDIEEYLQKKLSLLTIYKSEMDAFPFPRSLEGIEALARVRGTESGFLAAEGFCLLRERCS